MKKKIIKLRNEGKTLWTLSKIVGRTHSFIQWVINDYKLLDFYVLKLRSNHPSRLTLCEKRYTLKSVLLNPRITASQIVNDIRDWFKWRKKNLFMKTPYGKFFQAYYRGRVARKKPHLSAVNKQKRFIFANEYVN